MSKYKSLQERLLLNSESGAGECRLWCGYCQDTYVLKPGTEGAYGRINLTKDGRSLKFPVHRVAKVLEEIMTLHPKFDFYNTEDKINFFELYQAYSACGLSIDHLCKNTLCINPLHLEWVHLTHNQKRKLWAKQRRQERVSRQSSRATRHYRSLHVTKSVVAWIEKIRRKSYRKK